MASFDSDLSAYLDQQTSATPPSFDDDVGKYLDNQIKQDGQLRTGVNAALQTTPEKAARVKYLSNVTGLAPAVVQTNEGEAEARAKLQEVKEQSQFSPVLRQRLADPNFTPTALPDVPALSGIESGFQTFGRVAGGTVGRLLGGATVEVGASLLDTSAMVNDLVAGVTGAAAPYVDRVLPVNHLGQLSAAFAGGALINRRAAKDARAALDDTLPTARNSTESGIYSGAQSAGFNLATLPAAAYAATANGAAAAGQVMGSIAAIATGSRSYNEARDAGMNQIGAATYAAPAAMAEYVFEKWSGGKFFDDIAAKSPFLKMLFNNASREVIGENATTLVQNANEWLRLNPEKSVRQFISEQPDAMYQTTIAALVGSGITTGAVKGLQRVADFQVKQQEAVAGADVLQNIMNIAAGTGLHKNDPQSIAAFVQAAADGTEGAPKSLFIDGATLADTLMQAGVTNDQAALLMPSLLAQLDDAAAANSTVEIPTGELVAGLAGHPLEKTLLPHLRLAQDAPSQNEAIAAQGQAQQFLQDAATRVIEQAADGARTAASAEAVRQTMANQLMSTGRMTQDVANKGAALVRDFYTVMAAREGKTPEALYAEHSYKVAAQAPANRAGVLGQPGGFSAAGTVVDGLTVRADIPNQGSIGASLANYTTLTGVREIPLSAFTSLPALKYYSPQEESRTKDLAEQIKASGEITPLIVVMDKEGPYILEGGHRFDALRELGKTSFPAMVVMDEDSINESMTVGDAAGAPGESYNQQSQQLEQEIAAVGGQLIDIAQIDQLLDSKDIKTLTLQDLVGLDIFPTIADRTAAAALYTGIDSSQIDIAIPLLGGPFFPLRQSNAQAGVVWANRGKGVVAQKEAKLKAGANYMMVMLGDANMHQSNSTIAAAFMSTLEAYVRDGRMSASQVSRLGTLVQGIGAKAKAEADQRVLDADKLVTKAKTPEDKKTATAARQLAQKASTLNSYLENFPGFDDASVMHAYMDGMSFDARKRVLQIVGSKEAEAMGVPSMAKILEATREPSLAGHRWGDGVLLVEVDQSNPQVELGTEGTTAHPDFPVGVRGRVVGKMNAAIGWETLWQDWLASNEGDSPRRAFELAKPIVSVTQELIDRIGPINQTNVDSHRQARLASDFAADNWKTSDDSVKGGGVSQQEFVDAIQASAGTSVLSSYSAAEVKAGVKAKTMKVFQLGADGQIFFALKSGDPGYAADYGVGTPGITDNEVMLTSVVNNEQGARGIGGPAVVLKALQEGATVLDAFAVKNAKFPDGFLPELYAAFGFEKVAEVPFNPAFYSAQALADATMYWKQSTPGFDPVADGYPPLVIMKWKGTDADRQRITETYLRSGLEGLLKGRASANVSAVAQQFSSPDREATQQAGGTAADAGRAGGNQGAGGGASVASRARGTVQGIADLSAGEVSNLGISLADRSAVRRALGRADPADQVTPAADNRYQQAFLAGRTPEVLNQDQRDQYNALATPAVPGVPAQPLGTFDPVTLTTVLNANSNLSTFLHETGHAFVEIFSRMATNPAASEGIRADWSVLLKEMGTSQGEWDSWQTSFAADGKIPEGLRAFHERFAESTELYLFTGKAPNRELQGLFRTFRSWLTRVYKSIEQFQTAKGLSLSPELRGVMDRMLATDQQIADAEETAGLLPNLDATGEATEQLQARSLRDLKWAVGARNKHIKALQADAKAQRDVVTAEVTAEVEATPEMRAKAALDKLKANPEHNTAMKAWNVTRAAELERATAELSDALKAANPAVKGLALGQLVTRNKRDIANQAEAQALAWEKANPKPRRVVSFDDKDVQTIADSFGYENPEAMLSAIDVFGNKADAIEGMTDQRMLERFGDLSSPEAIAQAANEAVHNEARAKSLATELAAQRAMLNPRTPTGKNNTAGKPITVNALVEAAKQFAANVIGKRKLSDLKKAAWGHLQAERRAAKAWEAATAKGDTQAAVQAKQDQLLNNYAVREAGEAQAKVRKSLAFFARVTKGNNEALVERGLDPDVVNAARAILGAYGLTTPSSKTAMEYLAVVEKQDPVMFGAIRGSVEGAVQSAKPLYDLTTDELAALTDEIEVLMHIARRSRQSEVDGVLLDTEDLADEIKARLEVLGVPSVMPGDMGAITEKEKRQTSLQFAGALLRRVEQWAEAKDGKFGGPFLRYFFQPVKEAADRYRADRVTYRKKFTALVQNLAPSLQPGEIAAPELNGYTFGKGKGGIGRAELTHAILHTGNQSNKRKLLLGRGWAVENADGTMDTTKWDSFMKRMVDTGVINKAHYDFAQGVWDLLEETKPLAQKAHRDVFGRYFAEVTADSFDTPFGPYRGGYVPAQVDPGIVKDNEVRSLAEVENANLAYSFPTTSKGFTKGRVDYNRPLLLDLRTLSQHMDKVLLFSHMEPAVRDVTRLLGNKSVHYSLSRQDPAAIAGMLTPWLNRSARQIVETPILGDGRVSRILTVVRQRSGMALMIGNISNTVQQIAGASLAMVKVSGGDMKRATAQYITNPAQMSRDVSAASIFMKDRIDNEISALNESMEQILLNPSLYEKGQAWTQKHAYFLQSALDNVMGPIIWTAGYNQGVREGMSDVDAIRFADGVIRQTQGATQAEDVSRMETGPATLRLFTQFIGYFNMMANTNATALQQVHQELGFRKGAGKALGIVFFGVLAPAWIAEAVAIAFRGGPDDEDKDGSYLDDWLMAVLGMGTVKTVLASIPFVGGLANAGLNTWNSKPYDDRTSFSPAISLLEATVGAPRSVYKAIVEDGAKQKAVRDVATLISVATGLPAMLVARPIGYLTGVADNRIKPTGPADAARGIATGTASPESKR